MEVVVTTGAIRLAKLRRSKCHLQQIKPSFLHAGYLSRLTDGVKTLKGDQLSLKMAMKTICVST